MEILMRVSNLSMRDNNVEVGIMDRCSSDLAHLRPNRYRCRYTFDSCIVNTGVH